MNIVFFRHSLLSRGGDKMIVMYANHLAASGHQVTIKANVVDSVFTLDSRVSISPLRFSGKIGTILSAFFEKTDADLVIADIIVMVCLLSFLNRRKVICFAQDYDEAYYSNRIQKLFIRCLYFLGLTFSRIRTIAVSNQLAALLRNRFGADVTVVENGVDTNIFYPDPLPDLLSAKEGRKSLLLHSRADFRKGFDIAINAVEQLRHRLTVSLEIWTVGEPVQGLFPDFILRDFGYAGEVDLRRIMSSADVFLYPTRHEGFGLMPLEAMACGCAVVTTSAVPFAVHEKNSLVAEIEDCDAITEYLNLLLNDELLASRLIENGKQLAGRCKLSDAARQFELTLSVMLRK